MSGLACEQEKKNKKRVQIIKTRKKWQEKKRQLKQN